MKPPLTIIQQSKGVLGLDLRHLWQYRELLYFLIWREVKIRYKQTALGVSWAILQPLFMMAIFSAVFGWFARIPSDQFPYPIFTYAALLPWTYFAQALERSSNSLVSNANLISKVYFPRLIIPLAAVATPLVDSALAFVVFIGMMILYHVSVTWRVLVLPGFILLALLTALAISLWLSALNVKYRDVRHAVPFIIQAWMYASPIVYPVSLIPEAVRPFYSLNPMVGVIEGFRWALLGQTQLNGLALAISSGVVLFLLVGGLVYFKSVERTFADIV